MSLPLAVFAVLAPAAPAAFDECPRVHVLGTRGSGDSLAKNEGLSSPGLAFTSTLREQLRGLGVSVSSEANTYSAIGLTNGWREWLNTVGAASKIALLGSYHGSVVEGKRWLEQRIESIVKRCGSKTQIVLVGYSQGAQVVGDTVEWVTNPKHPRLKKQVYGAVLFADPYFNGSDLFAGQILRPGMHGGALGRRDRYRASMRGRVLSFCNRRDPICQKGAPITGLKQHSGYARSSDPELAAEYFAALIARGAEAPPIGFRASIAGGRSQSAPECSYWRSSLSCYPVGMLPAGATCEFGGMFPLLVLRRSGQVAQEHVCVDEGFHSWLELKPGEAWKVIGFGCAFTKPGTVLRCLAGSGGFDLSADGSYRSPR